MAAQNLIESVAYKPFQYQQVNPISFEQIAKTFNTLAEMHTKSVEVKSKLSESISNLPFNEKDEWYRQAILDEFNSEINSMRADGDLAGDYERILNLSQQLTTSKEFRGRLLANKKYQEFIDKVDKDQELSQVEKDFYKKNNPYKYDNLATDELGREVMYEWNPNYDVIHLPSMDEILKRAKTNIATRYYGDNHPLDLPFHTGQVAVPGFAGQQFITKDMLLTGMIDIIASDPKVKEGFKRKYEISKWHDEYYKDDKWEIKTNRQLPVDSATGLYIEYDEWLSGLLEPFASGAETYIGYSPSQQNAIVKLNNPSGTGGSRSSGSKSSKPKKTEAQKAAEAAEKRKRSNNAGRASSGGSAGSSSSNAGRSATKPSSSMKGRQGHRV